MTNERKRDPKDIYCGIQHAGIEKIPDNALYLVFENGRYSEHDYYGGSPTSITYTHLVYTFINTEELTAWANRNSTKLKDYRIFEVKRETKLRVAVSVETD